MLKRLVLKQIVSLGLVAALAACDGAVAVPGAVSEAALSPATASVPASQVSSDHATTQTAHKDATHSAHQAATASPAAADTATTAKPKYEAGKHYRVLSRPIPTSDPNKVEVAEFFWYGCGHCFAFEPSLKEFKASAPDYINVVPVPTMWRKNMEVHAKAYYAMKNLKKPELHQVIFEALNKNPRGLADDKAIAQLFSEHGVDYEKTLKMLSSFGVSSQLRKAKSLAAGARISGTPTLVVNGKYVVESGLAGSQANMLKIASYLAAQEQK